MISRFTFSTAQHMRLSALAEIQQKLTAVEQYEAMVHDELMAAADKNIRPYLEDEGVIKLLMQYGKFGDKMPYYQNPHGLTSERKSRAAFNSLRRAWQDMITIEFLTGDPRQMEVRITIVR